MVGTYYGKVHIVVKGERKKWDSALTNIKFSTLMGFCAKCYTNYERRKSGSTSIRIFGPPLFGRGKGGGTRIQREPKIPD